MNWKSGGKKRKWSKPWQGCWLMLWGKRPEDRELRMWGAGEKINTDYPKQQHLTNLETRHLIYSESSRNPERRISGYLTTKVCQKDWLLFPWVPLTHKLLPKPAGWPHFPSLSLHHTSYITVNRALSISPWTHQLCLFLWDGGPQGHHWWFSLGHTQGCYEAGHTQVSFVFWTLSIYL